MRVVFLSDIHANLPALRAALEVASERQVEKIVVAGDIVGDGPFPVETVETLMGDPRLEVIRGNVDREVMKDAQRSKKWLRKRLEKSKPKKQNRAWTALQLGKEHRGWLESLAPEAELSIDGRRVLVVHGSPRSDTDNIYCSLTAEALQGKLNGRDGAAPELLVSGHSHVPFVKTVDGTLVMNCGSAGRPADGDPRGSLIIADVGQERGLFAEIVRFAYPVDEVVEALREREVPGVAGDEYYRAVKP